MKTAVSVVSLMTLLISTLSTHAQTVTMGPGVTMGGASIIGGYTQSWSQGMRQITVALGDVRKDAAGSDRFTTGGAGVLIRDDANRFFIATALHVFSDPEHHWAPETLRVRGWKDEKKSRYTDFGSILRVRNSGKPLFFASSKFDLAIVPINSEIASRLVSDGRSLVAATPESFGTVEDTYDGAEVFILGFPALVGEEYQQRALMRTGIIAWTEATSPTDKEFLVDSRIFPGNSGGPVFSSAAGMTKDASVASGRPIKLLGIVSKTVNAKPELAFGVRLPEDAMVVGAAGTGIIEPAQELIALMAQASKAVTFVIPTK